MIDQVGIQHGPTADNRSTQILKPVTDLLRDLANAENGFAFAFGVQYHDGRPGRFLRIGCPRLRQSGAPHVWKYGANLIDFTWPADAANMAPRVFAQGTGDTGGPLMLHAEDSGAHLAGWPLLEAVASQLETKSPALLDASARGGPAARRHPARADHPRRHGPGGRHLHGRRRCPDRHPGPLLYLLYRGRAGHGGAAGGS